MQRSTTCRLTPHEPTKNTSARRIKSGMLRSPRGTRSNGARLRIPPEFQTDRLPQKASVRTVRKLPAPCKQKRLANNKEPVSRTKMFRAVAVSPSRQKQPSHELPARTEAHPVQLAPVHRDDERIVGRRRRRRAIREQA